MKVLVLNSGSSSQKVCLFDLAEILPDDPPGCLWEAKIEWDGESAAIAIKNSDGDVQRAQVPISSRGEALKQLLGPVPQVAVFDTGFHRKMPLPAVVYPVPYEWFSGGIRRYGFHGINHQYCAERTAKLLHKSLISLKLVTCHLGNGCSLAAIREGHSIDTTMGFTPLEGLMMGTRSGSVDPGILTYLMRR